MSMVEKQVIRRKIRDKKNGFSHQQLLDFSAETISTLELTEVFQQARCVLAYYSMADEVDTHRLIRKYKGEKRFVLPVVSGNELILKELLSEEKLAESPYGILEPQGSVFEKTEDIDLVIVPGVAFDRKLHRLGRGKGFYDRLLPKINAPKAGICFDFQLVEDVPFWDTLDVKMNIIISQNEIVVE